MCSKIAVKLIARVIIQIPKTAMCLFEYGVIAMVSQWDPYLIVRKQKGFAFVLILCLCVTRIMRERIFGR